MNISIPNHTGRKVVTRRLGGWLLLVLLTGGCNTVVAGLEVDESTSGAACRKAAEENTLSSEVLRLVNEQRETRGLNPLIMDEALSTFAADYACAMIEQNFFDHNNPYTGQTFNDRLCESSFRGYTAGENIAKGYTEPAMLVNDWMNSESHRDNILSDEYVAMGLGVRIDEAGQAYWVQHFIGEPPAYPELALGCEEVEEESSTPAAEGLLGSLSTAPVLPDLLFPVPQELAPPVTPEADDQSADQ